MWPKGMDREKQQPHRVVDVKEFRGKQRGERLLLKYNYFKLITNSWPSLPVWTDTDRCLPSFVSPKNYEAIRAKMSDKNITKTGRRRKVRKSLPRDD